MKYKFIYEKLHGNIYYYYILVGLNLTQGAELIIYITHNELALPYFFCTKSSFFGESFIKRLIENRICKGIERKKG